MTIFSIANLGPTGPKKLAVQEIDLMSGQTDEAEFVTSGGGRAQAVKLPHQLSNSCIENIGTSVKESSVVQKQPPAINVQPDSAEYQSSPSQFPPLLTLDPVQQKAAYHMTHHLNGLMCMVSEHFTSLER